MAKTTGIRNQLIALTVAALLAPTLAGAQEVPPLPTLKPNDLGAGQGGTGHGDLGHGSPKQGASLPDDSSAEHILPPAESVEPGEVTSVLAGSSTLGLTLGDPGLGDPNEYNLWENEPAITESTGTWLNRGFWYSQVDAVVMGRKWEKNNMVLARESGTLRRLRLGRSDPGREGSLGFTLGRFLFRDGDNRDHNLEFRFLGGNQFGQDAQLIGEPRVVNVGTNNNPILEVQDPTIVVGGSIDKFATFSFSGAESMKVEYDSRFNSFEANYTGSTRLKRDRMELLPTGQWIRRANVGLTRQWLAGLRYFDLTENVNWTANNITTDTGTAIDFNDADGQYLVRTSNDLFGFQFGGGLTYESSRFSIAALSKLGVFANDAKSRSSITYTDNDPADVIPAGANQAGSAREAELSFLTEFSLIGRYHVRPNISLRAGYQLLYLTQVALAPQQLNFNPNTLQVGSTGDSFYHGLTSGIDFYW